MARFLMEAKKELEEEISRSDQRKSKNKPRKPLTPQEAPSNRAQDYDIIRLAPHRHILGSIFNPPNYTLRLSWIEVRFLLLQ